MLAADPGGDADTDAAVASTTIFTDAFATVSGNATLDSAAEVIVTAGNSADSKAIADGSAAKGATDTAVGIAVSINVATMANQAFVGDADVTAQGISASAGMKDVGGDTKHKFEAKSTSGASGEDTGVAGSFALNLERKLSHSMLYPFCDCP